MSTSHYFVSDLSVKAIPLRYWGLRYWGFQKTRVLGRQNPNTFYLRQREPESGANLETSHGLY